MAESCAAEVEALGRVPSSRLAAALGVNASSVTRLADKLEARGYLARGADPSNRSVVTVMVTESGERVVDQILQRRRAAFLAVLNGLPDTDRESTVIAARALAGAVSAASNTTVSAKSVEWEGSSP
ncbi:DNA-binding MarR family transcriptional regulator [Nocardia sp. GAS34]|uniref:MarR family winged helix-turn-helix transcriptional regulator n=1 Tax=unclassified Nocardia TaxID=2637762 RepID=UPI003D2227D0